MTRALQILGGFGWLCFVCTAAGSMNAEDSISLENGVYHVRPGQSIQEALNLAAETEHKHVLVHSGTYRPAKASQALIYFNQRHDGITLEAKGEVTLTAANPEIADRTAASFPAVVNHVVYFGDGVGRDTVLRGFKISDANNYVTDAEDKEPMEPNFEALKETEGFYGCLFFYTDGGGIKIFGRSYPTLDRLEIVDCFANPCGGAISIEHRGFIKDSVLITNSIFRNNRSLVTGSAVDLLPRSSAVLQNCLFVGNVSNTGLKYEAVQGNIDWPNISELMKTTLSYQPKHGSGALTVFYGSRIGVRRCTFTGNFNGADDRAAISAYMDSIFWDNKAEGGKRTGARYELDVAKGQHIRGCFVGGGISDLRGTLDPAKNRLDCDDPRFNEHFVPQNPAFSKVGYRPVTASFR